MIDFLKDWTNQIIIAVIVATIVEMLLPNGNNKKYIKVIIGIYVLFNIIQPILSKFTENNLNLSSFNYRDYFDESILETSTQEFEHNNSKLIKQAYIDNIKEDVKVKIKQKGYEVVSCNLDIIDRENQDTYGTIKSITLNIKKIQEEERKEEVTNTIKIENVDISINTVNSNTNKNIIEEISNISEKERKELVEYISKEYSIEKKNIVIN